MNLFAIELSSRTGSVALLQDGEIIKERSWVESFKDRQQLFDAMAALAPSWDTIDVFAVGRGPGAFSGMRISFAVAQALAAPGRKPIYALNSGSVLTLPFNLPRSAVVGDARRGKVWAGLFEGTTLQDEFVLIPCDELDRFIPADTPVLSPDHDRLVELLAGHPSPAGAVPVFPSAGALGRIVYERLRKEIASEPLEPLYMHPPVFIAPRFS